MRGRIDLTTPATKRLLPPIMRTIILALLFGSALSPISTVAGNWPQFRGPNASGVDSSKPAPVRWNLERSENVLWQADIPGLAHSSPILWDDRVYVTTAVQKSQADLKVGLYGDIQPVANDQPQQWRLLALDKKTGKIVWNTLGQETLPQISRHPKSTHCNSTPATEGHRIVAIFGSEGLFCFDMDGKLTWKKSLGPLDSGYYVVPSAQWGFASSPVIHEGRVIVLCDVQTNSFIGCFDILNGIELWRTPRKDVPTWGTPTIAKVGSQTEILVNGWRHTGAYDFSNGKEIWKLNGGGDIPVPTPIVAADFAYFTSGHGREGRPIRAIQLQAKGDITPTRASTANQAIAWTKPRLGNYMQTPIVVRNNLYACFDTGVLTCFDANTGEVHYSERLGNGSEGFTSSPVSDGRNVYIASENGNVYVVPATTTFSVIATNKMNETCMATPLISGGMLCYRTRAKLVALSGAIAR
jgi:outer membrane protein assembly factor BamB